MATSQNDDESHLTFRLLQTGRLSWPGRLPGREKLAGYDVRYESEHVRIYVPIVSMLLLSLALSLIFYLPRRFFCATINR